MEIAAVALLLRNDNFILPKSLFYNNSQLSILNSQFVLYLCKTDTKQRLV